MKFTEKGNLNFHFKSVRSKTVRSTDEFRRNRWGVCVCVCVCVGGVCVCVCVYVCVCV